MSATSSKKVVKILEKEMNNKTYGVEVNPKNGWVLPNRAKFPSWVDTTFKYKKTPFGKQLFPHQYLVKNYMQFDSPYRGLYLFHGLGAGKCHGIDTPILMFDGTIKKVQDVVVGDVVMGDDSLARNVLSTCTGQDDIYEVINVNNGDRYTANSEHILSLKHVKDNQIVDISLKEYLALNNIDRSSLEGFKCDELVFPSRDTHGLDPYTFGRWLGNEANIHEKLLILSESAIPIYMKINDLKTRYNVLAGLIDEQNDKYNDQSENECNKRIKLCNNFKSQPDSAYVVTLFDEYVCRDVLYIARSLGIRAENNNKTITLSGRNISKIPVKVAIKPTLLELDQTLDPILVVHKTFGDYYGFTLDGNNRYVLGDFTVTHNSAASIASAEMLINDMNVVVLLPASLRSNFVNEVKKYGNGFFQKNRYWEHVSLNTIKDDKERISEILKISIEDLLELVKKTNGLWIPKNSPESNFDELQKKDQQSINEQIDFIIRKKYQFINYNDTRQGAKLAAFIRKKENIFDNKCVIIDEVHNLISTIVNVGVKSTGGRVYKLLMEARNCKVVLLSGTPMLNTPFEISFLINMITGRRRYHEIQFKKDNSNIEEILKGNPYIDYYNYNAPTRMLSLNFLPEGFITKDLKKRTKQIVRDHDTQFSDQDLLDNLKNTFESQDIDIQRVNTKTFTTLPEDKDDFNNYFVAGDSVLNPKMFMKRILGTVSYFTFDDTQDKNDDVMPSKTKTQLKIPMSTHQYTSYMQVRSQEREQESKRRTSKAEEDEKEGQVYRFFSRANCNFAFPDGIKRVYKSNMNDADNEDEIDPTQVKAYESKIKRSIYNLNKGDHLTEEGLANLSPKFTEILKKLKDQDLVGKSLVYSQFDTVEGLGLFKLSLDKAGFAEVKLKKVEGEWNFEPLDEETRKKPKYFQYRNTEDAQILLKVFNSEVNTLPVKIQNSLSSIGMDQDVVGNMYGNMIKVILITKSGSEGLSLKHVRFVHIMEPYWNMIRIDQVIGRAVRANSHKELPKELQTVEAYIYCSTFTKEQLKDKSTKADEGLTTDEYIYKIAERKEKLIGKFLDMLKKSSFDCALNGPKNPKLECFSFPSNIDENEVIIMNDIKNEYRDSQLKDLIKDQPFKGKMMVTKKGNFLIRESTNEAYDYDIYKNHKKLVKIGVLVSKETNGKKVYMIDDGEDD